MLAIHIRNLPLSSLNICIGHLTLRPYSSSNAGTLMTPAGRLLSQIKVLGDTCSIHSVVLHTHRTFFLFFFSFCVC